jgi:hypothetical protein
MAATREERKAPRAHAPGATVTPHAYVPGTAACAAAPIVESRSKSLVVRRVWPHSADESVLGHGHPWFVSVGPMPGQDAKERAIE